MLDFFDDRSFSFSFLFSYSTKVKVANDNRLFPLTLLCFKLLPNKFEILTLDRLKKQLIKHTVIGICFRGAWRQPKIKDCEVNVNHYWQPSEKMAKSDHFCLQAQLIYENKLWRKWKWPKLLHGKLQWNKKNEHTQKHMPINVKNR